jgi:hypothetical protein
LLFSQVSTGVVPLRAGVQHHVDVRERDDKKEDARWVGTQPRVVSIS